MNRVRTIPTATQNIKDMNIRQSLHTGSARAAIALAIVALAIARPPEARAQLNINWDKPPVLPPSLDLLGPGSDIPSSPNFQRPNRIRLLGVTPGFLSDPVGLDQDITSPTDPDVCTQSDSGPDWINLALGNDNPFFDIRRPGDPGGVGYYRVNGQVQLFDSRKTACSINLQAVTPAGRDQDGLADGPTVLIPAIAIYQELLDDGTAVQGFVGKQMQLSSGWTSGLSHSIHYGMALQRPLIDTSTLGLGSVYWYVGALGRYRFDTDASTYHAPAMDLMPGVHWHVSDNWWMAAGFIVPMTPQTQSETKLWQLTCSFRF
jgi:hypothetical protein